MQQRISPDSCVAMCWLQQAHLAAHAQHDPAVLSQALMLCKSPSVILVVCDSSMHAMHSACGLGKHLPPYLGGNACNGSDAAVSELLEQAPGILVGIIMDRHDAGPGLQGQERVQHGHIKAD